MTPSDGRERSFFKWCDTCCQQDNFQSWYVVLTSTVTLEEECNFVFHTFYIGDWCLDSNRGIGHSRREGALNSALVGQPHPHFLPTSSCKVIPKCQMHRTNKRINKHALLFISKVSASRKTTAWKQLQVSTYAASLPLEFAWEPFMPTRGKSIRKDG